MPNAQLEAWQGDFGDQYTARNETNLPGRMALWRGLLPRMGIPMEGSILEVGANIGQNLLAIRKLTDWFRLVGVEPNTKALDHLRTLGGIKAYPGDAAHLDWPDASFDCVFTSGVLIHLSPMGLTRSPLHDAMSEIVRVSKKWVVAMEYFSVEPREVNYRGNDAMLWTRDFGQYYIDHFGLIPELCAFMWKPLTGLDNLTVWLMRKP